MYIPALLLALFFTCGQSRVLFASSENRRVFYHSLRNIVLVEDVDLTTGFKLGSCSHFSKGKLITVSFYAGRFYPHYKVSAGNSGYLSDEEAYKACIEQYKNLKTDVLYDIGLASLALANFAKNLGITHDLNAVPALEFVINIAKRNIDRSDGRRVAHTNPEFVNKHGTGNAEDVHFHRPLKSIYKEHQDFLNRPVDATYFEPKYLLNGADLIEYPEGSPTGNHFAAEVRDSQRDYAEAGLGDQRGYGETGLGDQRGYGETGLGDQRGYGETGLGDQRGYGETGLGDQRGYGETGLGDQRGYGETGLGDQRGYAETGLGDERGYAVAGVGDKRGYAEAGVGDKRGYAEAGVGDRRGYAEAVLRDQRGHAHAGLRDQQGYAEQGLQGRKSVSSASDEQNLQKESDGQYVQEESDGQYVQEESDGQYVQKKDGHSPLEN